MESTIHKSFKELTDPRINRTKKHPLINILVITLCGVLCGAEDWVAIQRYGESKKTWLSGLLDLTQGVPSHDTLSRVFSLLNAEVFGQIFIEWTQSLATKVKGVIALDGKTMRGTGEGYDALHLVNVWCVENQLVLGQLKVANKSNEITAVPLLLELLDISGATITADAMGCQKNLTKLIQEKEANYVLALKENHPKLYEDVSLCLKAIADKSLSLEHIYDYTHEKDHGRLEKREYFAVSELSWLSDKKDWQGLQSIVMVRATRTVKGAKSIEDRFYISSLPSFELPKIAHAIRAHWQVENNLHWQLDVSFSEDQWRSKMGNAAVNMALINKIALNLLKHEKTGKAGIKNKRLTAAWNDEYLMKVLTATVN